MKSLHSPGRACTVVLAASLCAFLAPGGAPAHPPPEPSSGNRIIVQTKVVEKVDLVAIRHVGPYKSLSPIFAKISEFGRQRGISGPLIGVYLDDSRRVPPDLQKSFLGILSNQKVALDKEKDKPYEDIPIQRHQVVYTKVRGAFRDVPRAYKALTDWAWKNGYRVKYPVTEIYDRIPVHNDDDLVTEIQFNVERIE